MILLSGMAVDVKDLIIGFINKLSIYLFRSYLYIFMASAMESFALFLYTGEFLNNDFTS